MYKTMNKNNYGVIKEVKSLKNKKYEVIGDLHIIHHIVKVRPDLMDYNNITNIAATEKAEELQNFIREFKKIFGSYSNYEFIFLS